MRKTILSVAAAAMLAACGTNKIAQGGIDVPPTKHEKKVEPVSGGFEYVRKVNDNAVYAKNITAKAAITVNAQGKTINVDGRLQMRKDEVIRITVVPFGLMEVGRLEFAPDYVLLINRLEKEYVTATYNDLDFLRDNGLDFYTLQALFWNELFVPGKKKLQDSDLTLFTVDAATPPVRTVSHKSGKLSFQWSTNTDKALIDKALITYAQGTQQSSTMTFDYGDFLPMGSKRFPSRIEMGFASKTAGSGKMSLALALSRLNDDATWEARSNVSGKYKKVSAQELLDKLMNM